MVVIWRVKGFADPNAPIGAFQVAVDRGLAADMAAAAASTPLVRGGGGGLGGALLEEDAVDVRVNLDMGGVLDEIKPLDRVPEADPAAGRRPGVPFSVQLNPRHTAGVKREGESMDSLEKRPRI
eukprot:5856226-Pyramimonas_sp.AAC.1